MFLIGTTSHFRIFPFQAAFAKKSLRSECLRINIPSKGSFFLIIYISCVTILPLLPPHKTRLLPGLRIETGSRPVLLTRCFLHLPFNIALIPFLSQVLFSFVFSQEVSHQTDAVAQGKYPGQRVCQADRRKTGAMNSQPSSQTPARQFPDSRYDGVKAVAHSLESIPKDHQRAVEYEQAAHNE